VVELVIDRQFRGPSDSANGGYTCGLKCFVCGWAREDGMRIYAGPVEGRDLVAATWIPGDDVVSSEFVWAALDCPGAYAVQSGARGDPVLGRLAARVEHLPHPGERCVLIGWPLGEDGRKLYAGTALFGEDGRLRGSARATWIIPRPSAAAGSR
jgi:hypothetical protein